MNLRERGLERGDDGAVARAEAVDGVETGLGPDAVVFDPPGGDVRPERLVVVRLHLLRRQAGCLVGKLAAEDEGVADRLQGRGLELGERNRAAIAPGRRQRQPTEDRLDTPLARLDATADDTPRC